ncbi:MAG: hypothetical protein JW888_16375 [Pirellulales bacterium]|nr:hypothetical protein [Pirellulales bacterium]
MSIYPRTTTGVKRVVPRLLFSISMSVIVLLSFCLGCPPLGAAVAREVGAASTSKDAPKAESTGVAVQSIEPTASSNRIRFQRAYVPADRVEDWPLSDDRYLPLDMADFERLLKRVEASANVDSPRIVQAEYRASLSDDGFLKGNAFLLIEAPMDSSSLLSLGASRMAIEHARWRDSRKTTTLGLGREGDLCLQVQERGQFEFEWSLGCDRGADNARQFVLELPPTTQTTLVVELPESVTPIGDRGVCVETTSTVANRKTWRFELGGQRKMTLRLTQADAVIRPDDQPDVRESFVYDFSPEGVELKADLRIESLGQPPSRVCFLLDPELRLVTAKYGQTPVLWSISSASGEKAARIVVELPKTLSSTPRVLHLNALCPLVLDRPWRLPAIRSQEVFWRERSVALLVPASLRVEQIEEIDCRQSRWSLLPGSGEATQFQCFSPEATVELVLSQPCSPIEVDYGAAVELDGSEATGKLTARFKARDCPVFELEARVNRPWIVDTVTSDTAGTVRDWRLDPDPSGGSRLIISLAKALPPDRGAVQVEITGRRLQSPLGRTLKVDDLTPVRFPAADVRKRLLDVRARVPYELVIHGDERLRRISPADLDSETRTLLPVTSNGLRFLRDAGADLLRIGLHEQRPGYLGELQVEATVSDEAMLESYCFRCTPQSTPMNRLLVHFALQRDAPLRWSLDGEEDQPLSARRLTPEEQAAAGAGPGGETWEIALLPSHSEPFEIRASRTTRTSDKMTVSLAAVLETDSQTAMLVVRAAEATPLRIVNRRLEPIPTEPAPPGEYQTARATFRYKPEDVIRSSVIDPVTISISEKAASGPAVFAWNCRIDSRYGESGGSQHRATYELENLGGPDFGVTVPVSSQTIQVRDVRVDGEATRWQLEAADSDSQNLLIDLPPTKRFPLVVIDFSMDSPALGFMDKLEPPKLKPDVPVLAMHWIAWFPANYHCYSTDSGRQPYQDDGTSWRERLFGPLGRPTRVSPFDPFSSDDWAKLNLLRSEETVDQTARRFLTALGTLPETSGSKDPAPKTTLGEILRGAPIRGSGLTVLVDGTALVNAGVSPTTTIDGSKVSTRLERGTSLLRQTGLTALVRGHVVLVTSSFRASLLHSYLEPTEHGLVWQVVAGPLALEMKEAAGVREHDRWSHVSDWLWQSGPTGSPWLRLQQDISAAGDTPGWNACCQDLSVTQCAQVRVIHDRGIQVMRWVAFFMAIGFGRWRWASQPVKLALAAALGAILALLFPLLLAAVASGATMGILFCLGVLLFRLPLVPSTTPEVSSSAISRNHCAGPCDSTQSLKISLSLLLVLGCCIPSIASEPNVDAAPFRVLIPVDEQRKPTGKKAFVPEPLYRQLTQQAVISLGGGDDWLIERVNYQGELVWEGIPKRLVPGEMRAVFHIRVFGSSTRVRVPLSRENLSFADDWAFLDGRAIRPQWEADQQSLSFIVSGEGYYRLEIIFTPTSHSQVATPTRETSLQDERGFDVRIPRVPRCRLELALPSNVPAVEVPSAQGRVVLNGQQLSADLGATDALSVRWRADAGRRSTDATVEVDQLLWLNITPGSVLVDARFHVRVLHGRVNEIRLSADPRLTPLGEWSLGRPEAVPGDPGSLRVKLATAQTENFTFDAHFSLQDTSGVGRHRLPLVKIGDAKIVGCWFAVSVDDSLQWIECTAGGVPSTDNDQPTAKPGVTAEAQGTIESVAVPDFLAAWGDTDASPRLAYRHRGGPPSWSIAARPRQPRTVIDQQRLTASLGENRVEVRYQAEIDATAGSGFRYRLHVPPTLTIDSLAVHEEDMDRLARWSRAIDGSIDMVFTGPATGRRHLLLEGHVAVPQDGFVDLPIPRLADAYVQFFHVALFRQSPVLLELDRYEGLEEAEPEVATSDQSSLGRLVVSLINSGQKRPRLRIKVSPNRPRLDVHQTLSMEQLDGKWYVKTHIGLESRHGLIDEVRLSVPPDLTGHFEIEPLLSTTETVFADGRKELIIRGAQPITDRQEWFLSIPFTRDRVVVPNIAVQNAFTQERHLVLPRRADKRPLYWDTQQLEKISSTSETTTYRIVGKDFRVSLLPSGGLGAASNVYLAEVQLAWREDGTCQGVAHFDLERAGRGWCPLFVPKGYQLVHVSVDGVPTTPTPSKTPNKKQVGGSSFRIPLGLRQLPRGITVVFTGRILGNPGRSSCTFDTPRLGDLPVGKSLWLVSGPRSYELLDKTVALRSMFDVLRADSLARMLEVATKSDAETSDKGRWCRAWRGRFCRLESVLEESLASSETTSERQPVEKTLQALRRRWTALGEQMGDLRQLDSDPRPATSFGTIGQFWQNSLDRPESIVVVDQQKPLTLHYRRTSPSWAWRHLPAVFVLGLFLLLGYQAVARGFGQVAISHWPQGPLVGLGLAWWLLLTPSVVGLGIVLLGLWLTIRSRWRNRRASNSLVVPLG